ncbi:MAG: hypothetical protein ACWIPI_05190 [Polaribacter sp.]
MVSLKKIRDAKKFLYKLFDVAINDEISVIEEAEEKVQLPEEYLERFTLYALQDKGSLKDRENELKSLELAYENWKIVNTPLLLVNNPGEGGTSLLHASTYIYPSAKILETNFAIDSYQKLIDLLTHFFQTSENISTLNHLEKEINSREENYIIILENIERLFIRRIKGFNLLEDFLLFMHVTKSKIYWIVSINKYSFYYLNSVKYFSSHFPSIIHLNPVDNEILKEEILMRNQGYNMVYLKPNKVSKKLDKQFKKITPEERQKLLENMFFKRLFDFSKGNMSKAILYARDSAYNVKEKIIFIKPFKQKEIEGLSLNDLFILEAIFQHRSLTIEKLNIVLRNSDRQSKLSIEKLLEKNLIKPIFNSKKEVEYRINLLYVDILKERLRERLNRNFR